MTRVVIWDLPVRLCHGLLIGSVALAWASAGHDRWLDVHVFAGYGVLGLLGFRLWWGLIGTRHARFVAFRYGPRAALAYLRDLAAGRAARYLGHNPAGSWAIYLMLGLLLAVSASGLYVLGAEEGHGPLRGIGSIAAGVAMRAWHAALAWVLLALVAGHVAGVAMESRYHRESLVRAMVDGCKLAAGADAAIPNVCRGVGLALLMAFAGFAGFHFWGYATATAERPYLPFTGQVLADDPTWREQCGACHTTYHPSLLPARSWAALLAGQRDHFGEDLVLEESALAALGRFLTEHAAEREETEAAYRIHRSVAADATPLRITATPYWRDKHAAIPEPAWSAVGRRSNCGGCHLDAEQGSYADGAMRLP
ncbi:MAG TPA: cytochrome b/b6 domain-containing protein [Candidatus Competibacteraceae bacterium]|nr:cytochrome b/b6 domain-containing protein [Candidatus Competibacteraceae bacterium]